MRRRELLFAGIGLLPAFAAAQTEPALPARVVMASIFDQAGTVSEVLVTMIYTEAFRQLGVALEIRAYPPARARAEALAGNVDGELTRGYDYEPTQRVLMRVAEPLLTVSMSAYARQPGIQLAGWDSLRGSGYRVEVRSGYPVIEQHLAALVRSDRLSHVVHSEQGLKKLALGRTDIYIDAEDLVEPLLATGQYPTIHKAGLLERSPVYCYLNRRHQALALRLADVLRHMKASGQIERLRAMATQTTNVPTVP